MQWDLDRGTVEPRGEDHAHQLPGAPGSLSGSEVFAKDKTNLTIHLKKESMSAMRIILLKAQHLAGVLNTIADDESRVMKDQ